MNAQLDQQVLAPETAFDGVLPGSLPDVAGKGFARRAAAFVIDLLVFSLVTFPILFCAIIGMVIFLAFMGLDMAIENLATPAFSGVIAAYSLLYFVLFEWLYGATPGKALLGMRVVRTDGRPCTVWASLVRGILRPVDSLFLCLVAYLSMQSEPRYQQRLGDKAAHTVVSSSHDPQIQSPRGWSRFVLAAALFIALYVPATPWLVMQGSVTTPVSPESDGGFLAQTDLDGGGGYGTPARVAR
jgi:uncharacterized RDD family membrane protein YckC